MKAKQTVDVAQVSHDSTILLTVVIATNLVGSATRSSTPWTT
jgi:hypothetical protein